MRRKKIRLRYKKERVLFSDVLPYEIPFIFTNRYFYRFLVKNKIQIDGGVLKWDKDIDKGARLILSCLFQKQSKDIKNKNNINVEITSFKSIPFIYNILHKPNKCRLLSIIHPANQMMIVDFYNKYKNSDGWDSMDKEVFWDLFDDYEARGGDGFIHSKVEPVMRELKVIDKE